MNMLVSATAIAAASPVSATTREAEPHDVFVMELLPPPGPNSDIWSGFTLDGKSQRWSFGAGSDGEICFAFREDRSCADDQGNCSWWSEDAPVAVRNAVRRAVLDRVAGEPRTSAPDDPALALIERCLRADAALNAVCDVDEGQEELLGKALTAAQHVLIECVPTTSAGAAAVLRYFERQAEHGQTFAPDEAAALFGNLAEAIEAAVCALAESPVPPSEVV